MDAEQDQRTRRCTLWRFAGVEWVGLGLGLGLSLCAATPLIGMAAEIGRLRQPGLNPLASAGPGELWAVWLASSLLGGCLAIPLARWLACSVPGGRRYWLRHLVRLLGGSGVVGLAGPLIPGVLVGVLNGRGLGVGGCYLAVGGVIGWQAGVIAFVFLYTFRALEMIRSSGRSEHEVRDL